MPYCVVARSLLRAERRSIAFTVGLRVFAMRAIERCGMQFPSWLSSPETRSEGIGASKQGRLEKAADVYRRLERAGTSQLPCGQLRDAAGAAPTRRTVRRPIRHQAVSLRLGSSRPAEPAITNRDGGRYLAIGEHLALLSTTDL